MDHLRGIALQRIRPRSVHFLPPLRSSNPREARTCLVFRQEEDSISFFNLVEKKSKNKNRGGWTDVERYAFNFSQWRIGKENINRREALRDNKREEHIFAAKKWVVDSRRWSTIALLLFSFPPPSFILFYTRTSSRRIASLSFFFSFYFPPSEPSKSRTASNTYLDCSPASDYDDPSTTTVSSFSFDLWITDNRIRWTCSSYPLSPAP